MWGHSTQQAWGPTCPRSRWSQPGQTHTRNAGVQASRASKPAPLRDVDAQLRLHSVSPLWASTPSAASAPLAGQNSPDVCWQPTRRARVAPRPWRVPPELQASRAALEPVSVCGEPRQQRPLGSSRISPTDLTPEPTQGTREHFSVLCWGDGGLLGAQPPEDHWCLPSTRGSPGLGNKVS